VVSAFCFDVLLMLTFVFCFHQAPPVGYSIPVARGTGLGTGAHETMSLASTGTSFNNGVPPMAPSFARPNKETMDVEHPTVFVPGSIPEDKEDDVFVPGPSSKLPGGDEPQHYSAKTGYDNADDNDPANEGGTGASYDDLAARFDRLNK
jgi:hypothetical protein